MADPMTPERLAEIRDRELSASEGPWLFKGTEQQDDLSLRLTIGEAPGGEEIARIEVSAEAAGWSFHRMGAQADAEFIAHARSDVPALLAEVERLRAELADAMAGWKKADIEAEQARAALAKTQDHRAYLQERLRKSQKEAAGRKAHGERLRAELALWENTRPYVAWLRKAKAERDEARTEAGQLRAMYDDLCKSMSQTGDRLATAERERDEAREQVRVLAGLLKRGNPKVFCAQHPNHAEPGCEVCRDAEIFRSALGEQDGDQTDG